MHSHDQLFMHTKLYEKIVEGSVSKAASVHIINVKILFLYCLGLTVSMSFIAYSSFALFYGSSVSYETSSE